MADSTSLSRAIHVALAHHRAGRLAEAQGIYRQILGEHPNHADALHLLGVAEHQLGHHVAAIDFFNQSIAIEPREATAYANLAVTLLSLDRVDEAAAASSTATQLSPDSAHGHFIHANALRTQGKLDEAINAWRRAIVLQPEYADAYNNLGNVLKEQGLLDEAVAALAMAVQLKPHSPEALANLGDALTMQGKAEEAIAVCSKAVEHNPNLAGAWYNLARGLRTVQRFSDAVAACSRAVELNPKYADVRNFLGAVLMDQWKVDEAIAAYSGAIDVDPDCSDAWNNLGNVLKDQGRIDEGLACHDRAMAIKPHNPVYQSNRLYTLHFHPAIDSVAIYDEHRKWDRQHAQPLKHLIRPHRNNPERDRPLRIGYVSPDLWAHPVGRFLLPLLANHDREKFAIFCYSDAHFPDPMTEQIRRHADLWQNITGQSDKRVCELIRGDEIDLLIDLAGHTGHNRLLVFARRPAPVQATYLGYPDTTGMTAIDYRITDSYADPPGMTEAFYSEQLERLPLSFLCFSPTDGATAVAAPPALKRGQVTFGSFNAHPKINGSVVRRWAQILHRLPGARMLIKCKELESVGTGENLLNLFAQQGISGDRVELRSHTRSPLEHLQVYDHVDIALDTFPYAGTTTTCEALWMGVPVVTLAGKTHVSRVGVSIVSNVGLPEWIARSPDEYERVAVEMAGDLTQLAALRATLRERMRQSPLMDAPGFARNIETSYREMWRRWSAGCGA